MTKDDYFDNPIKKIIGKEYKKGVTIDNIKYMDVMGEEIKF